MSRAAIQCTGGRRIERTRARRNARRARRGTIIGSLVCVAIMSVFLVMSILGVKAYVITGGSMQGAVDRGALIFTKTVPVGSLQVGDIITFQPPGGSAPVTHRIISVTPQADGKIVFGTKGDVNESADPWLFTLDGPIQAKYLAQIPYLGYGLASLGIPIVRGFLFGAAALFVALIVFRAFWGRTGEQTGGRAGRTRWPGRTRIRDTALTDTDRVADPLLVRRVERRH